MGLNIQVAVDCSRPHERRHVPLAASQGPHSWHTMADPEGNEFCIR